MPSQPLSKWEYGVSCIKASNALAESLVFIALTSNLTKNKPRYCSAMRSAITGALLYELFCCIKSIKKTFDEQRVLPSFSCNVEAVLRNEEIYEADLWYKELSGDIE